jgi:hypothetical protein
VKARMRVAVYTDKSLGLFPMRGFGRTGHRQVPSAICRVPFGDSLSCVIPEFALALFLGILARAHAVLQVEDTAKMVLPK